MDKKETLFADVMGNSAHIRIIGYLVGLSGFDMNISDLSRGAQVSRNKASESVKSLLAKKIIKKTRSVSGAPMYAIDEDNKVSKKLFELYKAILNQAAYDLEEGEENEES